VTNSLDYIYLTGTGAPYNVMYNSFLIVGGSNGPCSTPGADACADVGNPADEFYHNLSGWGANEMADPGSPATPSGDRSVRFQALQVDNSLHLFLPQANVAYTLLTEVADGDCDDSFEIHINGQNPVYTYHAATYRDPP